MSLISTPLTAGENILAGNVWIANNIQLVVASGATVFWLIKTGTNDASVSISIASIGDSIVSIHEDATITADGVSIPILNMRRSNTTATIGLSTFHGPTISSNGALLVRRLMYGGDRNDLSSTEGSGGLVFKASTDYLVEFTNEAAVSVAVSYGITVSEVG